MRGLLIFTQLMRNQSEPLVHTANQKKERKGEKEAKSKSRLERLWRRDSCVPCALPFPSSQRLLRAHLSPSIKCQADHIDAPPSPQQSLISEQTPTLQRAANSVREADEVRAASLLWLAESSRQSSPRSLFSSMSSSVGGEAHCKKYP